MVASLPLTPPVDDLALKAFKAEGEACLTWGIDAVKGIAIEARRGDVLILGVGNPLMGDDGVGIQVIELLTKEGLPANVVLKEAGLPGLGLPYLLEGNSNVILVDAMHMGQTPGTWKRYSIEDIQVELSNEVFSLHEHDLGYGIALSKALGILPENLILYGIEPADLSAGSPLSLAVQASMPEVIDRIMRDIEKIVK